jgi:hypothetical protein
MAKCKEINPNQTDFKNPLSVLASLLNLFKIPPSISKPIPNPIILASEARPGLSPSAMAARIIKRQSEAGIPVGPLPSGRISPSEIMERIRMEEIVNALTTEAKISVATKPGAAITSSGANAGGPLVSVGNVISSSGGNAIMT